MTTETLSVERDIVLVRGDYLTSATAHSLILHQPDPPTQSPLSLHLCIHSYLDIIFVIVAFL